MSALGCSEHLPLLLVGVSQENRLFVRRIAEEYGWEVFETDGFHSALESIRTIQFAVVLCEQELADGNWRQLLDEISGMAYPPNLVVASRLANTALWAEVLNLGAYDLLTLPFDAEEVRRAVSLAADAHSHDAAQRTALRRPVASSRQRQPRTQVAAAACAN